MDVDKGSFVSMMVEKSEHSLLTAFTFKMYNIC